MRYHNITKDDMLNGDGLRVVLWVSAAITAVRNVRIRSPGIQMAAFRLTRKQKTSCLRNWAKAMSPVLP